MLSRIGRLARLAAVVGQRWFEVVATALLLLFMLVIVFVHDAVIVAAVVGTAFIVLMLPLLRRVGAVLRGQSDPQAAALVADLTQAIAEGQLKLLYQPLVDLRTGEVTSLEALVRWEHPTRGMIPPDRFIPLAERSAFFWDFSLHILGLAVEQAAAWIARGIVLPVAVNVSSGNLLDPRLPGELRRLLAVHELPAKTLELEVTEGAIMEKVGRAIAVLGQVAAVGVGMIAIDDFGTGYSSLARVRDLPIDALKIDRSFVAEMDASGDSALVRSIIALGHNLGIRVIAEGIETRETWGKLARLGCDAGQGYCISRPLDPAALEAWLTDYDVARPSTSLDDGDDRRRGPGRRRNDYFAVAFDNAPEAMLIADDSGRWVDANVAACNLLGVTRDTLRSLRWGDFSSPEADRSRADVWAKLVGEGQARGRWSLRADGGESIHVEFEATGNFLPGLHLFLIHVDGSPTAEPEEESGAGRRLS